MSNFFKVEQFRIIFRLSDTSMNIFVYKLIKYIALLSSVRYPAENIDLCIQILHSHILLKEKYIMVEFPLPYSYLSLEGGSRDDQNRPFAIDLFVR